MKNKKELRKEILARRNALSKEERCEKSKVIAKQVIALEEFHRSNKILLYAPIKSEVETQNIYQEAKRRGKDIYYPRVLGDRMEFYLVDDTTEFDTSRFGICEPIPESNIAFEPSEEDEIFVLMPGAVFDIEGNRIGYGGGYYDKYLQRLESVVPVPNIYKVAVAYECQIVEAGLIGNEPHDRKVDGVVTEESTTLRNSYRYFENRHCRFYPCHDMVMQYLSKKIER